MHSCAYVHRVFKNENKSGEGQYRLDVCSLAHSALSMPITHFSCFSSKKPSQNPCKVKLDRKRWTISTSFIAESGFEPVLFCSPCSVRILASKYCKTHLYLQAYTVKTFYVHSMFSCRRIPWNFLLGGAKSHSSKNVVKEMPGKEKKVQDIQKGEGTAKE